MADFGCSVLLLHVLLHFTFGYFYQWFCSLFGHRKHSAYVHTVREMRVLLAVRKQKLPALDCVRRCTFFDPAESFYFISHLIFDLLFNISLLSIDLITSSYKCSIYIFKSKYLKWLTYSPIIIFHIQLDD